MIFILSDSPREASLLGTLCDHRAWPSATGGSVADFTRLARSVAPRAVVVRQKLADGYSDDILREVGQKDRAKRPRVLVLMPVDCSIQQEARQVALGADCVLRDPLRIEVLLAYLAKYRARGPVRDQAVEPEPACYEFAGVRISPNELLLTRAGRKVRTTSRVLELLQPLHRRAGHVVPYAQLYSEVFGRRFSGDTANCRVLLAKAAADFRRLGVNLRTYIRVIPKSGYLYASGG